MSEYVRYFVRTRLDRVLVQVTLADQQADPNSPLYSAKTFEELGLSVRHMNLLVLHVLTLDGIGIRISSKGSTTWVSQNRPKFKNAPCHSCSLTREYSFHTATFSSLLHELQGVKSMGDELYCKPLLL